MEGLIYLDHHATTPVDPRVLAAMLPYFREAFGNAASRQHAFGWRAEAAVEKARTQVARAIGAEAKEIVFTSGATEGNNLAIFGVAERCAEQGRHLIVGATEHRAVLDPAQRLAERGYEVAILPVDRFGRVDPEALKRAIRPDTILISLMFANNEVGTLHPVVEIGKIAKERGVLFHCDAAQALGKVPIDVEAAGIDLLTLSAHKFYGPKGVGAIYVRGKNPRVRLAPLLYGGGHERGLRSGTLNVPGIVGMGEAAELATREMAETAPKLAALRDRLWEGLRRGLKGLTRNGHPKESLPNNLNVTYEGVRSEVLMMEMKGVAVSSGSACSSAEPEPSHVLRALGLSAEAAKCSIRYGLGKDNTEAEIDRVVAETVTTLRRLRERGPLAGEVGSAKEGIDS
ncbi:MAG: cysteine desulfurase [Deltaproteobacteria bacterium]|nr:cysteine desulfurase [Deltaproteobacteria bacterium]